MRNNSCESYPKNKENGEIRQSWLVFPVENSWLFSDVKRTVQLSSSGSHYLKSPWHISYKSYHHTLLRSHNKRICAALLQVSTPHRVSNLTSAVHINIIDAADGRLTCCLCKALKGVNQLKKRRHTGKLLCIKDAGVGKVINFYSSLQALLL